MISFVGGAVGGTSATLPSFNVGDLALVFAFRDGSTTAPSVPAGWTSILTRGTTTSCSQAVGYRVLVSGDTTTGNWTNASSVTVQIYRSSTAIAYPGGFASTGAVDTTVHYPTVTLKRGDGTSWVAGFAGHRSTNTSIATAPAGMTNREHDDAGATCDAAGHDTNGGVSSWSDTSVSVGGTSSGWQAATVEIVEAQFGDKIQVLYTDNFSSGSAAAFPQAVHAGALLIAAFGRSTNSAPTVTDTQSDSYASGRSHYDATNDYRSDLQYAIAASTAACSITVTATGGAGERTIAEYYGPFAASPLDTGADASGTSINPTSGNANTAVDGELAIGSILAAAAATSFTVGSGYTSPADSSQTGGTNADSLLEHKVVATAGTSTAADCTLNASNFYIALLALFKPVAGSASITPPVGAAVLAGAAAAVLVNTILTPLAGALAAVGLAGALAVGSPIAPSTGALTLTGQAPTVTQGGVTNTPITPPAGSLALQGAGPPLQQDTRIAPPVGALALSGSAPAVGRGTLLTPPAGALALAASAPGIGRGIAPPAGSLVLAGQAPTVTQGGPGNTNLVPGAGNLALAGSAPSLVVGSAIQPPAGALALTGQLPAIVLGGPISITPPAGSLALAGAAPTVIGAGGITPPAGALALAGAAPGLFRATFITPGSGAMAVSGGLPPLGRSIQPPAGILALSGIAPTVSDSGASPSISPPAGAIALAGQAPTVVAPTRLTPAAGSLALSGQAPTAVLDRKIQPGSGALVGVGAAPSLLRGSVAAPPAGALVLAGAGSKLGFDARPAAGTLTLSGAVAPLELGFPNAVAPAGFVSLSRPPGFLAPAGAFGFDAPSREHGFLTREEPAGFDAPSREPGWISPERPT